MIETKNIDDIIVIEKGKPRIVPSRSFREDILGNTLEQGLQKIIEDYPQIIPGSQIAIGAENPPKFLTLCSEMPISGWELDILLVDQFGIPTLVETKLYQNPESRREVVGQIMDYAASAKEYWSDGKLKEKANEYWNKKNKRLSDVIKDFTDGDEGDEDSKLFWKMIENNIDGNNIRLIIATDKMQPRVRKIVEFLNKETKNIEILGLELHCYGKTQDHITIVPVIIGNTYEVKKEKGRSGTNQGNWNYENLKDYYLGMDNKLLGERLLRVLEEVNNLNKLMLPKTQQPNIGIENKNERRVFSLYVKGDIYTFFYLDRYNNDEKEREQFINKLNELTIFQYDDIHKNSEGKNAKKKLGELSEEEFNQLLEVIRKC